MIFKMPTPFIIHASLCTNRVRKSRIESCSARLESDMFWHREEVVFEFHNTPEDLFNIVSAHACTAHATRHFRHFPIIGET